MKTPEEIKKGLEYCQTAMTTKYKVCSKCAYYDDGYECENVLREDALAYIQQLERERDAAVALVREFAARINSGEDVAACEYCNKEFGVCNCNCLKDFEMRGAQEVE